MKLSRYYASLIAALMLISPLAAGSAGASQGVDKPEGSIVQIQANAYVQEGVKKFRRGDYQGAIEDFNQALRLNPNLAPAYGNISGYQSALDLIQKLRSSQAKEAAKTEK